MDSSCCSCRRARVRSRQLNGGVHQAGDIELHKAAVEVLVLGEPWLTAATPMDSPHCSCRLTRVRSVLELIPDPGFSGYGIFDQEAWRALYAENDDGLSYSSQYSIELVRRQHPSWTDQTQIELEAARQYNAGAKLFFTETLRTAKRLRPNGKASHGLQLQSLWRTSAAAVG